MTAYAVATDYDYSRTHKRQRLTIWSGFAASVFEASALALPSGRGYAVTTYDGDRFTVAAPAPRDDHSWQAVDAALSAALTAWRASVPAAAPGPSEAPTRPPRPQSSRMHRVSCTVCGYVCRASRRWLAYGAPICPTCNVQMRD